MKFIRAKHAGFCWGVRRAVEMAEASAAGSDGIVWTDGPLIHNRHEVARLAECRIRECADPSALVSGDSILIRAHGIPPARKAWLEGRGLRVLDATCPNVRRIHRIVTEAVAAGEFVFIFGDKDHAEVIGICGCCPADRVATVSVADSAAVDSLDGFVFHLGDSCGRLPPPETTLCLVSQTTQEESRFRQLASVVQAHWPRTRVVRTICTATHDRQGDLDELAAVCDILVVVGSPSSANTGRLARLAAERCRTIVVDSADDLRAGDFSGCTCAGITAGASTPESVLVAVERRIAAF